MHCMTRISQQECSGILENPAGDSYRNGRSVWVKLAIDDIFYAQAETVISSASERQPEMRESGEHSFGFRSLSERSELAEKADKKRRRRSSSTGFVSGGRKTVLP